MSNRVIITGARAPVALDLGRSFAAAGYRAVFADSVYPFAANWSDVSNEPTIRLPKARQAFPAYQEKISALLSATETPFIMPTCEEVFYVSAAAESVGRESQVFAPPLDTLKTLRVRSGSQRRKHMGSSALRTLQTPFPLPARACSSRNIADLARRH
jgi:hypothetical protein